MLLFTAFVTGFVTLGLELTASRLLAPAFGTSLFVWANIIGVILLGLSVGYVWGGRIADRHPDRRLLGKLLLGAGLFIVLLPFLTDPFLDVAKRALTESSSSIFLASLAAVALLILPPTLVLGMCSPFVIRLRATSVKNMGSTAGNIYALSTLGSIMGVFVPTLYSIPFHGSAATIFALGTLVLVNAAILLGPKAWVALALPLAAFSYGAPRDGNPFLIDAAESPYQHVYVEDIDGTRYLRMNEGIAFHSVYTPGASATNGMYDSFLLADAAFGGNLATMANIGLAGGTIAHLYQTHFPDVRVTGVEIDPVVVEMGKKHFTLNDPNLEIVTQDGRIYLATTEKRFDAIVVDAYRQPYIPFQLTTTEFFAETQERLAPGGVLLMNVATAGGREDRVLTGILNTVSGRFAETYVYKHPGFYNFIVFATDTPGLKDRLATTPVPGVVDEMRTEVLLGMERVTFDASAPVFTDDKAPVELFTDLMLLEFAQE